MKAFVTGGAGFIGSHIVDRLIKDGHDVTVYDNFSTGQMELIQHHEGNERFKLVRADLLEKEKLMREMKGHDIVFHIAANADVRGGIDNTKKDFEQNIVATYNVLEGMRINGIKKLVFSSSAVVYGEPEKFPTPEDYPLIQTSMYGASKLSCEGMIEAFSEYYDIQCWIFRFVSWIGPRYSHGVIYDFVKKLMANPKELEILGDGKQKKSYLDVEDGVEGIFHGINNFNEKKNIFNLGHDESVTVVELADVMCKEMGLENVQYKFTGGARGWIGDSPFVHLDITKLKKVGWNPKIPITDGIKRTVKFLLDNKWVMEKR